MEPAGPRARTYDVFLAFSPGASMLEAELASIGADGAARVLAVDLHYRIDTDVALVRLRIDASLGTPSFLSQLRSSAAAAGASVLEPQRLPDEERTRFYGEHLAQYPFCVTGFPTVADAARKLGADLGWGLPTPPAAGPSQVKVRWRTGDRWHLGRARNLTREGFYVYSSAPPKQGEVVTMVLTVRDDTLTLKAAVVHVTPDDAAVTVGGPGFGGRFIVDRPEERSLLERMVAAGRGDGLGTLRSAPPRREARYAVRWPVTLGQSMAAVALDISFHGLFVSAPAFSHQGPIVVRITADDGGDPLRAKARVARVIDKAAGHGSGVGLELQAFAAGDADRWEGLTWRVGERSRRRLIVAGHGARMTLAADQLAAAGYVVTTVTTKAELDALLTSTVKPDLIVLDGRIGASPKHIPTWLLSSDDDDTIVSVIDGALLTAR